MDTALPSTTPSASSPAISPTERFDSVDLLRGVAVCGILVMNITSFAMPAAAYLNPNAYLGDLASTHVVYAFTHVFADQKFMGLFSLLFGSSVMLFIKKLKAREMACARFYYARTAWLLVFGFLHGVLLWEGDILVYYALCGLFLYPFWRVPPRLQFTLGLIVFLSAIVIDRMGQSFVDTLPEFSLETLEPVWSPSHTDIILETEMRLSGYSQQLADRIGPQGNFRDYFGNFLPNIYIAQGLARAFGLMLVGMAFYSWGIVTAQRSLRFYRWLAIGGFTAGLPIVTFGLWRYYVNDWSIAYGLFAGLAYNHVATPLLVFAYIGVILYIHQQHFFSYLRRGLCAIGRMAFSNYIGQSLICTSIFYGYGLALFGRLDRPALLISVIVIWVFQFYFSLWWLSRFQFGPLEWLWRALTYFRLPSFKITNES
jgi:uncharacterized protein